MGSAPACAGASTPDKARAGPTRRVLRPPPRTPRALATGLLRGPTSAYIRSSLPACEGDAPMTRVPPLGPREDGRVIPESGDLARRAAGDLSALDRRTFLRLLGAVAGAGLLPAACTREPAGVRAPSGLRHLSRRGWAVLNAAAARIAGPEGAKLVAAGVVDPALGADRFLDGAPALVDPLGQALLVVEYAVWPLSPKLRPFTSLAPEAQDAVLADLAGSRLETKRRIFGGVRAMALLGFYAAPEARALTGYPIGASHPDATIADAMTYPLDE